MEKMIEYRATINGMQVCAEYSERAVNEIFIPLLQRLTELQQEKESRILVMLAAPPAAGKTTLLSFLEKLSHDCAEVQDVQVIGMDGFHRKQEFLKNNLVLRDGEMIPMVEIKGAPETFDLDLLTERVGRVASGEVCGWPEYDRLLHDPVEDAVTVDSDIVILEGNYLLLDEDGWRELQGFADYTVSITADPVFLRTRLIDRRIRTGRDEATSMDFVDFSDMPNITKCIEKTMSADLELNIGHDGDYHVIDSDRRLRN